MRRMRLHRLLAVVLVALIAAGGWAALRATYFSSKTVTADFSTATGIYPGDEVRISGVKVGTISAITPDGGQATMTLKIDHGIKVPASAKAVIVAQNLVAARYVQLAPAYNGSGPVMADGAVIPIDRTAIPVEWDQVKEQLNRLATDLGPTAGSSATSVGRFIDSTAGALGGDNAQKLRDTLAQLSGVARIFAGGAGNLVDVVKNLQVFITTLRNSSVELVQFQGRLALLTSVLDGSRSDLDAALTNVSDVVGDVERFVRNSRNQTSEQVQRLANVTQTLVDHRRDLEQILHVAPNAIANAYQMFDPRTGGASGVFTLPNMADPIKFICGMIGARGNVTAGETADLCKQYLGPGLRELNFNNLPIPFAPFLSSVPRPEDLIYTDPKLMPGGAGADPGPPEVPPAVSAYAPAGGNQPQAQSNDPSNVILPLPAEAPPPPPAPAPEGAPPP